VIDLNDEYEKWDQQVMLSGAAMKLPGIRDTAYRKIRLSAERDGAVDVVLTEDWVKDDIRILGRGKVYLSVKSRLAEMANLERTLLDRLLDRELVAK